MIIAIGDIHGRDTWQTIVQDNPNADRYIFVGDYFDSFDVPFMEQMTQFNQIVQFKRDNPDKVILLIGNHDYHYIMSDFRIRYSGYQDNYSFLIREALLNAKDVMQLCYHETGYLFIHAGLSTSWCKRHNIFTDGYNAEEVVNQVNELFVMSPLKFDFQEPIVRSEYVSSYGDNIWQSPLWIRPDSLVFDKITLEEPIIQIVGHTDQGSILIPNHYSDKFGVIFIDALRIGEYLIINLDNTEIGKVWK